MEIRGSGEIRESGTITLSCIVQAASSPVITWLRRSEGGVTVLLNTTRTAITTQYNPTEFVTTSALTITRVLPSDRGDYICEADTSQAMNMPVAARTVEILSELLWRMLLLFNAHLYLLLQLRMTV